MTEAINRLIVRYRSVNSQKNELAARVEELEARLENSVGSVDSEGYNILRIHSARLLRERQEIRRRLAGVLEKLESIEIEGKQGIK
ncbi:MAG: hypothetical protein R6U39_07580 [Candidatus Aegiribacteria sp.]